MILTWLKIPGAIPYLVFIRFWLIIKESLDIFGANTLSFEVIYYTSPTIFGEIPLNSLTITFGACLIIFGTTLGAFSITFVTTYGALSIAFITIDGLDKTTFY